MYVVRSSNRLREFLQYLPTPLSSLAKIYKMCSNLSIIIIRKIVIGFVTPDTVKRPFDDVIICQL